MTLFSLSYIIIFVLNGFITINHMNNIVSKYHFYLINFWVFKNTISKHFGFSLKYFN